MINKNNRILLVLAILIFGILLRWQFGAGLVTEEGLTLAKSASLAACTNLQECFSRLSEARALVGIKAIVFLLPTSFFYTILGVNDFSSALQGVILSVASGLLIYIFTTRLTGKTSGFLSLFLWAVNPADVFSSRIPNFINFEILVSLVFISVLVFSPAKRRLVLLTILLILGLLVDVRLCLLLLVLFIFRHRPGQSEQKIISLGLVALGFLFAMVSHLAETTLSNLISLFQRPESVVWIPLLSCALFLNLSEIKKETGRLILAWLFLAIAIALVPICSNLICTQETITVKETSLQTFSLVFAPMIVIIASGLGRRLTNLPLLKVLPVLTALILLTIYFTTSPQRVIYELDGLSVNREYMMIFSMLTVAVAFVLPFVLLTIRNNKRINYTNTVLVYMFFFAFASFSFFEVNSTSSRFLLQAYRSSLSIVNQQSLALPVAVESERSKLLLQYVNGFEESKIRIPEGRLLSANVYALSSTQETNRFAEDYTWWKLDGYYGQGGDAVSIFRVLDPSTSVELANTEAPELRPASLINAGLLCEGYQEWLANPPDTDTNRFLEIFSNCLSIEEIEPVIDQVDSLTKLFPGIDGGLKLEGQNELGDQIWSVSNYIPFYPDWRVYNIPVYLEPDSVYLLTLTLKTQVPTISLYIGNQKNEWLIPQKIYSDWTNVQALFSTHGMKQEDMLVIFSPVLFDHYQSIQFTNFSLGMIK